MPNNVKESSQQSIPFGTEDIRDTELVIYAPNGKRQVVGDGLWRSGSAIGATDGRVWSRKAGPTPVERPQKILS